MHTSPFARPLLSPILAFILLAGCGGGGGGTNPPSDPGDPGDPGGPVDPPAAATRPGGACQAGVTYAAPVLTGTPTLLHGPEAGSGTYEGPVWLASRGTLLLSDISFTSGVNPSSLLELTPPRTVGGFLQDAGINGMAVDGSGTVYACSHAVQGIVRLDLATKTATPIATAIDGKAFNSPNDLVVRSDGTIYFTDPDFQLGGRTSQTGRKGVYRIAPGGAVSLVDGSFKEPNGIALSPDESVLYVADYSANVVRTFQVAADGTTSGRKDFASVTTPDGFAMDCLGNLYVASGSPSVIQVYAPSGAKLGSVTVAPSLSNMAFGGADGKTLYATAGKALYALALNLPGYAD